MSTREIVLDTETTGLDPAAGHRLVEVAGVEVVNGVATGDTFHVYVNPQRDVPEDAFKVHGLSTAFLAQQPLFEHVVDDLLQFLADSPLIIHNAEFDMRFINAELERAQRPRLPNDRAVDTLVLARRKHPGASNSLDALCARYRIDASRRVKHSALLDARLLAEVYAELTGGRQAAFILVEERRMTPLAQPVLQTSPRATPLSLRIEPHEAAAHRRFIEELGAAALWLGFLPAPAEI